MTSSKETFTAEDLNNLGVAATAQARAASDLATRAETAVTKTQKAVENLVNISDLNSKVSDIAKHHSTVALQAAAIAAVIANVRSGVAANRDLWRQEAALVRLSKNQEGRQSSGLSVIPDGWVASSNKITFSRLFSIMPGNPKKQDASGGNQAEFDKIWSDLSAPPIGWIRREAHIIRVTWKDALNERFFEYLPDMGGAASNAAYLRRTSGSITGWGHDADEKLSLNTWRLAGSNGARDRSYLHRQFLCASEDGVIDILLPAYVVGVVDFDKDTWRWWHVPALTGDFNG